MNLLLDEFGYPTEYSLARIQTWKVYSEEDFINLMEFVKDLWYYPECFQEGPDHVYTLITLGWSGNESVIGAMQENVVLDSLFWYSSERGGKHIYAPTDYSGD